MSWDQVVQVSTFINNLSTIDIPTKGKVYINDTEVRSMGEN